MNINVSKNLYQSLINRFAKEEVNRNTTFDKKVLLANKAIYNTIVYDGYIEESFENCVFNEESYEYQGVVVDDKFLVFFSMALDDNLKDGGRNTFLAQGFWPAYKRAREHNLAMKVSLNPFSFWKATTPEINIEPIFKLKESASNIRTSILEMKMLGVEFSNTIIDENRDIFENNLNSYINSKTNSRYKNKGNNGMWLVYESETNTINVYGVENAEQAKNNVTNIFSGAKWGDIILSCLLLRNQKEKWNINNFNFIIYEEYNGSGFDNKIKFLKEKLGFTIENIFEQSKDMELNLNIEETKEQIKRRQHIFRRNIEKEYNFKIECFACNYKVNNNLKAAHIHRFADIKSEYINCQIDFEEATKQTIDGVNGFLLCPNHDAEFEVGQIYFDLDEYKFKVNDHNRNITYSTNKEENRAILNELLNNLQDKNLTLNNKAKNQEKFEYYVHKHFERINLLGKRINN